MLLRYIQRSNQKCIQYSSVATAATAATTAAVGTTSPSPPPPPIDTIKSKWETFRTIESNPTNHSMINASQYYTLPVDRKKQIFSYGGLPKSFEKQIKTFGEACLMVREPALELMHYIKGCDLSRPTVRYLIYGKDGCGKSLTLAHILHFGFVNEFVLVHVPWVPDWFKKPKEKSNSVTHDGMIDLPLDAATWLIHFKAQNYTILSKLNLKCSQDYVWSKREVTPAGSTLLELIEHGIARMKFASDTIDVLLNELKRQSTEGKCKTMVAIDGFNSFFNQNTKIRGEHNVKITPDKITLTQSFLNIVNYDWCNGVCVLVVDGLALTVDENQSELPYFLLGKKGFELINPYVPIHIDNYTDKEYRNCIDYYLNRRWIQTTTPGFEDELKYLSAKNPFKLMELCAPL